MVRWMTGNITSHGTKLHYYRSGGSRPPLVLLHGISDDGLCWSPVAEVLSEEHDIVMVDLRGHGQSDAPETGYEYFTMAAESSGLINGLGLESPIVIGHSLGAVVAMTMASLNPDIPQAIVLEDPPAFWRPEPPSPEEVEIRDGMRVWLHDLKRKTRDDLLEMARSENPTWSDSEIGPWADSKHRFSLRIAQLLDPQMTVPADLPTLLAQIACPVLLITADPERGAIVSDADVAELQKSIPQLERVHIPGAGHNIRREQFSVYMESLQAYLHQEWA